MSGVPNVSKIQRMLSPVRSERLVPFLRHISVILRLICSDVLAEKLSCTESLKKRNFSPNLLHVIGSTNLLADLFSKLSSVQ